MIIMKKILNIPFVWVCLFTFALQQTMIACPNCKEGFDTGTTQAGVGSAYGFTIYLLIAVPIAIVITLALKIKKQMDANDKTALYRAESL
jgi:ABC-type transporter Mla maintaining outer membrane lipid asymmetry permease subunit MlaE